MDHYMTSKEYSNWINEHTPNDDARFVLGEKGKRPLICFGINCSTARPEKLDRTVRKVQLIAKQYKFDGWVMLNLYAQRKTNPKKMEWNKDFHLRNLEHIGKVFKQHPNSFVWAAWGNEIERRLFLKVCLKEIAVKVNKYSPQWHHKGEKTIKGHPRHPLYLKKDAQFHKFENFEKYLIDLDVRNQQDQLEYFLKKNICVLEI